MDMAEPDRSRVSSRQVTTATPAGLDFRAIVGADEGCADTMSAESPYSMAQGLSGIQDSGFVCHTQASGIGGYSWRAADWNE
jgi:hypothetical protein